MGITDDPNVPHAAGPPDEKPVPMADTYLVLSEAERAKGFVRPVRDTYRHIGAMPESGRVCGGITTMGQAIAETYARNPHFYGATFCVKCSRHRAVGPDGEFEWLDGSKVGT